MPPRAWPLTPLLILTLLTQACDAVREGAAEEAAGALTTRAEVTLDETDGRLSYTGPWIARDACCGTASYRVATGPQRTATLSFDGADWDLVEYYGCTGAAFGAATVRVDDSTEIVRAARVAPTRCGMLLYRSPVLGPGPHTWRLTTGASGNTAVDKVVLARSQTPRRLELSGRRFLDGGLPVKLRGGNFEGVAPGGTEAEKQAQVTDFTQTLRLNFARYRISFDDVSSPSCLSAEQEAHVADIRRLTAAGVWVLVEMRAEDRLTSDDASFYTPGSPLNQRFKCAWSYVAAQVKNLPFIAGYGVLAEPSTNKIFPAAESPSRLVAFQLDVMDHLTHTAGDQWTPFFLGPDYNYDTMQYRHDLYFTSLPEAYRGRVAYEVNVLVPKPWPKEGTLPGPDLDDPGDLGAPIAYPQPDPRGDDPFAFFVTPQPGEEALSVEQIFARRTEDPRKFPRLISRPFTPWYLAEALAFAERHQVPMVVDQFGAADVSPSGVVVEGQVAFEADLIAYFEAQQLGWSRWGYNAGDRSRRLSEVADTPIRRFYAGLTP